MPTFLNTSFKILAFVLAATLIWRVLLLIWKVEYAESILSRTAQQRRRLLDSYRRLSRLMKLNLFLAPLLVIVMPLTVYFLVPQFDALVMFVAMLELTLLWGAEYYFETWLVRYVTDHENHSSTAAPVGQH